MTESDLVVRGGVVMDGSGSEPFTGDIAIEGGAIRQVGRVDGRGRRELDADGAVGAPGFVDIHTHYDAQSTRLLQLAGGYRRTVVSGVETYRDGQPTGELPGRLRRSWARPAAEVA